MQHQLAKLVRLGRVPILNPTLEHSGTTSAHQQLPASVSAGDLHPCREQNVDARGLSSAHGPSSVRPGGQGQLQTGPASSASLCTFQICESDGPQPFPGLPFFLVIIIF